MGYKLAWAFLNKNFRSAFNSLYGIPKDKLEDHYKKLLSIPFMGYNFRAGVPYIDVDKSFNSLYGIQYLNQFIRKKI